MANIRDVARQAGVSVSAVSRALNNYPDINPETKSRILQVARDLHYVPAASAKQLVTKRSNTIGVFYPDPEGPGLKQMYIVSLLDEFKRAMGTYGFDLMLFANTKAPFDQVNMLDRVRHRDVDGVLVLGDPGEGVSELLSSAIPVVGVDYTVGGRRVGSVTSDNRRAMHDLVGRLYRNGYRKFGYVTGALTMSVSVERLQGFNSGMASVNLAPNPAWVISTTFTLEGGRQAAERFIQMDSLPEVIVCAADITAIGVLQVFDREGIRVPQDVSLVGYDDIEAATYVHPQLTTVRQDTHQLGTLAARTLVDLIENEELFTPQHFVLPTQVIVRDSTRPLPEE